MIQQRDIVLLSFPFSDLQSSKVRPVVVLTNDRYNKKYDDFVAVPLTTNLKPVRYGILITNNDLDAGRLIVDSKIRVDKILSINKKLVRLEIGKINRETYSKITKTLLDLIR